MASSSSTANNRLSNILSTLGAPQVQANSVSAGDCGGHIKDVPVAAPDAIFFVKQSHDADKDPRKVNVGIGAYRTDEGKPLVLECVKKAEQLIVSNDKRVKEYLGQQGDAAFLEVARTAMFGENASSLKEGLVASLQALSGTGALRLCAEFFKDYFPGKSIYISNPTWGNHKAIFKRVGVPIKSYTYWDANTRGLNLYGMLSDLRAAPMGSIVMLHTCAHNPTGVDPTKAQWDEIAKVCKERNLYPLFDTAYQGFATGDLENDCYSVRLFDKLGFEFAVCQSFAKNIGLYGERVGAVHFRCSTPNEVKAVMSQVKLYVRWMYSNPPRHGAAIVATVLGDPELYALWQKELTAMSLRIKSMRDALKARLIKNGTPGTWEHITSQIGMFSFTGLTPAQCEQMTKKHHVYMLKNGRISMAGVTSKNVNYLADAIDDCVRNF